MWGEFNEGLSDRMIFILVIQRSSPKRVEEATLNVADVQEKMEAFRLSRQTQLNLKRYGANTEILFLLWCSWMLSEASF